MYVEYINNIFKLIHVYRAVMSHLENRFYIIININFNEGNYFNQSLSIF